MEADIQTKNSESLVLVNSDGFVVIPATTPHGAYDLPTAGAATNAPAPQGTDFASTKERN